MFKIVDGREHFYQWDLDRQIAVEDNSIVEVHFCNRTDDCSLVVEVVDGIANVPNILLQSSFDVRVFGYDGKATLHDKIFKVKPRTRPADYVYTETEVLSVEKLIQEYLEDNPVSMDGYATEEYVANAIASIPEVDLTGYATEKYVEDAIADIDIPSSSGGGATVVIFTGSHPYTVDNKEELVALRNYMRENGGKMPPDRIYGFRYSADSAIEYPTEFSYSSLDDSISMRTRLNDSFQFIYVVAQFGPTAAGDSTTLTQYTISYNTADLGGSDWNITTDAYDNSLYNAKEIYISASSGSERLISYVIFYNSVLGENTYSEYPFNRATPDVSCNWWYDGWGISTTDNYEIEYIAYKS
jgi:hypothetical protein